MKRAIKIALGVSAAAGLGFTIAAAFAHPEGTGPEMMMHGNAGPMMGGPMAGAMHQGDASFADDMRSKTFSTVSGPSRNRTIPPSPGPSRRMSPAWSSG